MAKNYNLLTIQDLLELIFQSIQDQRILPAGLIQILDLIIAKTGDGREILKVTLKLSDTQNFNMKYYVSLDDLVNDILIWLTQAFPFLLDFSRSGTWNKMLQIQQFLNIQKFDYPIKPSQELDYQIEDSIWLGDHPARSIFDAPISKLTHVMASYQMLTPMIKAQNWTFQVYRVTHLE